MESGKTPPIMYHPFMHSFLIKFIAIFFACLTGIGIAGAQEKLNQASFGTGFIVSKDGHVATAYHNIKDKEQVLVGPIGPAGSNRYVIAQVVRTDAKKDLALLKTKLTGNALRISPWNQVPIGLEVYAIGYPQPRIQGISRKITQGIINGDRTETGDDGYFQFSAETQKGNSGGPLLAPDGSVIGVVRAKLNALSVAEKTKDLPQNVNYAIKSSTLLTFLQESGLNVPVNSLKLHAHLRAYEVYRQTTGSVVVVIARNKSSAANGIQIAPKP